MTPLAKALYDEWMASAHRWEKVSRDAKRLGLLVWNPALYTSDLYKEFITRFPPERGAALFLGLNPGPHGMSQTGIPFTDCRTANARLGLPLEVPGRAPADLQRWLKKPNGRWRSTYERSSLGVYRLLDLVGDNDLHRAFSQVYVANPCPLLFFSKTGKNVTPADPILKRLPMVDDLRRETLRNVHAHLAPRAIVCLGSDSVKAMGPTAESLVGEERFIPYAHPARAIPHTWALTLHEKLSKTIAMPHDSRLSLP